MWRACSFNKAILIQEPNNLAKNTGGIMSLKGKSGAITPIFIFLLFLSGFQTKASQNQLVINDQEYLEMPGLNVMIFHDFYPEGHQGGISIIQHGFHVATNGDLRINPTPGQWQPLPKVGNRKVNRGEKVISVSLSFPDKSRDRKGFNPMVNPDLEFDYDVKVKGEGKSFRIIVDLEKPIPENWIGKVGFNLELFPGNLFGKTYYMDDEAGIFPQQANGPVWENEQEAFEATPIAVGKKLIVTPEDEKYHLEIESKRGKLKLIDGRINHNNGWFVVRTLVPKGATDNAVEWVVTPAVISGWKYEPVIHVSQVGYHPDQEKVAVIELDKQLKDYKKATLQRISPSGGYEKVFSKTPKEWGEFLRYQYLKFDFSDIKKPGMYILQYGNSKTEPFEIGKDIYQRHVWQPTLEYFLPVQMCHMRVNEKYRVWHGLCHMDDALMAPTNINHFDGYKQGESTLSDYKPLQHVPGLNVGGWHDAGDYDLRVESQAGTVLTLSLAYEEFDVEYDQTLIDQNKHLVEIHHPDGKPDILQQIEHGVLSILGGYQNLGRLYRGIISPTLRQYVHLGDASTMTDNLVFNSKLKKDINGLWYKKVANKYSKIFSPQMNKDLIEEYASELDDRMVFTEINPARQIDAISGLSAASRVLRKFNTPMSEECLKVAEELWDKYGSAKDEKAIKNKIQALAELIIATDKEKYKDQLIGMTQEIKKYLSDVGWTLGRVLPLIDDKKFVSEINESIIKLAYDIKETSKENPFGIPYNPHIWGAGWKIQEFGLKQYFLYKGWPEVFDSEPIFNALNFILGCHPGRNTSSFASGVGSRSVLVGYGLNRADWSYIPGGVCSGTAIIRPDFPDLKEWPYLWQQTEYVVGGGGSNFMFLVLAADNLLQ